MAVEQVPRPPLGLGARRLRQAAASGPEYLQRPRVTKKDTKLHKHTAGRNTTRARCVSLTSRHAPV